METFPLREKDFAAARRQYVETHGSLAVMNTYLRIALIALSGVVVSLAWLDIKTYQAFHHLQPLVIRINEAGRAEAINYGSLAYQPQEAELKYFLVQFVHAYYGRV